MVDRRFAVSLFDKARHDRSGFDCGVGPMDRWLRESAAEQVRLDRLRLWCAVAGDGGFAGYYALAMHAVVPGEAPGLARRQERHPVPAVYLPALAVDRRYQGQGLGAALLGDAIARCVALSDDIGAAAIVIDVLRDAEFDRRRAFYVAAGFREIGNGDPGRLFLSMRDARAELTAQRG